MGFNFSHRKRSYTVPLSFLLVCFNFCGITNSSDSIKGKESLHDPEFLVSNGKRFKFGFFSPVNSSFRYVGVMYNDIRVTTVVWVANRDKPLNDSTGTVEISKDGNLVVLNGEKEVLWSTNLTTYAPNSTAMLLDTGNLVLKDNFNGSVIWECFGHASDSFLCGMTLFTDSNESRKNILTSWRSPDDPAPGRFTLSIVPLEFPRLYIWKDGYPYWKSGPWNGQVFVGRTHSRPVYKYGINIVNDIPGTAYISYTVFDSPDLYDIVLNSSGSLQEKLWSEEKGDWVLTWSSMESECDAYAICGPFASCNVHGRPICTCFPKFEPNSTDEWSAGNWSSGCRRKTSLQCEKNSTGGEPDGFLNMNGVKLPDSFEWAPVLEEECRSQCLNNCSCIAYAYYTGIGCMLWAESLIDVQKLSGDGGGADLFVKVAHSDLGTEKDLRAIIAITVVLGVIAILACAYVLKFRGRKRKIGLTLSTNGDSEEIALKHNMVGFKLDELLLFDFELISNATNEFDSTNKLGRGGFGSVYKGKMPNGQEIAVKRLERSSNQGQEEFMNEVEVISMLQHRNLVRLLGCCAENSEKLLVYEYLPNKSLDAYLFDSNKRHRLDWHARVIIIEGICRGLLYLHRDSRLKIIHRDLKASNILLDEELNPKISDFGTARIFGYKDDEANTTRIVGTFGYMPPEYALHGIFSEKLDVYSFGVLLLEIVSGRKNTSFYNEDEQIFLISYAWKLWNEHKLVDLIDPVICGDHQMESEMARYVNVGLLCVQEAASDRPSICTVLAMLHGQIVYLPHPKKPAFVQARRSHESLGNCSVNSVTITVAEGR